MADTTWDNGELHPEVDAGKIVDDRLESHSTAYTSNVGTDGGGAVPSTTTTVPDYSNGEFANGVIGGTDGVIGTGNDGVIGAETDGNLHASAGTDGVIGDVNTGGNVGADGTTSTAQAQGFDDTDFLDPSEVFLQVMPQKGHYTENVIGLVNAFNAESGWGFIGKLGLGAQNGVDKNGQPIPGAHANGNPIDANSGGTERDIFLHKYQFVNHRIITYLNDKDEPDANKLRVRFTLDWTDSAKPKAVNVVILNPDPSRTSPIRGKGLKGDSSSGKGGSNFLDPDEGAPGCIVLNENNELVVYDDAGNVIHPLNNVNARWLRDPGASRICKGCGSTMVWLHSKCSVCFTMIQTAPRKGGKGGGKHGGGKGGVRAAPY